eukprot:TRINITY_DN1719_c0_g1_i2.p1 TRINITY_DN1719_c0_g1~~TRINITY_DN1719_c0_g1_i2.p1  ORF type:complete len:318 (+),score=68.92 TRINITY_DN1719_c0_g1_i2:55-1008(+)
MSGQEFAAELLARHWFVPSSLVAGENSSGQSHSIRFGQFNILAECYATSDSFPAAEFSILAWNFRLPRLIDEVMRAELDIVGMEEVDHFDDLLTRLTPHGYNGIYEQKESSSPTKDGCALFYRSSRFHLVSNQRILLSNPAYGIKPMPQASILAKFQIRGADGEPIQGSDFVVAVAHLKAKKEFEQIRLVQSQILLDEIKKSIETQGVPIVIVGDMNSDPDTVIYNNFIGFGTGFKSAYSFYRAEGEPNHTTAKVRKHNEVHTIDYIFYDPVFFSLEQLWHLPTEEEMGPKLLPSARYPSDHLLIGAELKFAPKTNA